MYNIEDVNYMLSLYCPGECVNCSIWTYDKQTIRKGELLPERFAKALRSHHLAKVRYFDLTAGESQLSPHYVETVRLIAQSHPEATVHTNISGWYPQKHYEVTKAAIAHIPPEQFRIDISLDGRPQNYAKVRLVKGGFEKAVETLELLKPLGIRLRLTMIVYESNYKDIAWLAAFAKEHGVDYFIGYARNAGLLNNLDRPFRYTPQQLDAIEKSLHTINWLDERRMPNWLWAKSIYQEEIPLFECFMGSRAIVIDPYGNVYPCNECLEMLHMGNLNDFDGDLDALLESAQALGVLGKIRQKACQPCGMLCAHKIEFPWGKQAGLQ